VLIVRWSDEAVSDPAEIIGYIEERNEAAATKLKLDITAIFEWLGERPFIYGPGRVAGTRESIVRPNYLIVYRVGDRFVDGLRRLHAAWQYP
jgi:plasmid stabilization system protein ParE